MKLNQPPKDRGADQNGLLRFVSALRRALSIAGSPRGLAMRAALIAACLVAAVPTTAVAGGDQFDAEAAPQAAPVNYQGLWWAAPAGSQSGWGLNLAHQGDVIFATWFTYAGIDGHAQWYFMTLNKQADGSYAGDLMQSVQPLPPWYSTGSFSASKLVISNHGTAALTFSSPTTGTFEFVKDGNPGIYAITMEVFGPLPTCVWGVQPDLTKATNYTDLWWAAPAGEEPGWGVYITQQGDVIFATWFTYPYWMSVTATKTGPNTFSGTLIRTIGPSCCSPIFFPSGVTRLDAGTATFTFADGNNATFFYAVNVLGGGGTTIWTKQITRQVFEPPGTVCQ
ncbi:MAG TPA: hypothetical protein VKG21_06250 [Casimicrobiaceae bacterium]|nr:hypothetical protein [Casimicrobiaceae bacterium]